MPDCPICGGRKHIYKNGILERCECLINELIQRRLREAGVSRPYEEIRYDNLEKIYPKILPKSIKVAQGYSDVLKKGHKPKLWVGNKYVFCPLVCFSGPENSARDVLTANILKDSIMGGFSVISTSISELVTRCFDKNENLNLAKEFYNYDVLCVNIGNENTPNLAQKVFRDLIRLKANSESFLFFSTCLSDMGIKDVFLNQAKDLFVKFEQDEIELIAVEPV